MRRGGARGEPFPPAGLRLVHEDADLLIVDKPPGLLTSAPEGDERPNVFDFLKEYAKAKGGSRARVWIIHRLDKEASGLLAFAKSTRAYHWLKDDFKTKRVHRLYLALIEGAVPEPPPPPSGIAQPASGTIQSLIIEEQDGVRSVPIGEAARESARSRMGPGSASDAKLAVTHWRLVGQGQGRALVQLRLETGRKNQIRVHMRDWGKPIVGDDRYGATTNPIGRLGLHACELGVTHPDTGQIVRFRSPAPASFYRSVGMEPPGEPAALPTLPPAPAAARETSWEHVAAWYDRLIDEKRSDHFDQVILPGTLRLVTPSAGTRVLDVACGQGELARRMGSLGAEVVGIDASASLIAAARSRPAERVRFEVRDARALADDAELGVFDAATCVMALMNIDRLDDALAGTAARLRPGGTFTAIILHPAFRAPGQTSWQWDVPEEDRRRADEDRVDWSRAIQYRRVDGYLSTGHRAIVMNPGASSSGAEPVTTLTFHRPIQAYARAFTQGGLMIDVIEEWPSVRGSQPGPRAAAENRARNEIPMFLALRGRKPGGTT